MLQKVFIQIKKNPFTVISLLAGIGVYFSNEYLGLAYYLFLLGLLLGEYRKEMRSDVGIAPEIEIDDVYGQESISDEQKPDKNAVCVVQDAVSLIFIDNYEAAFDSIEDAKRPVAAALIDNALNALAVNVGGILSKFEKDRYLLIFPLEKLNCLKESKFKILDEVRSIAQGAIPITLSIGIGAGGVSLTKSMEYARAAIDLSLGRGGDQVVIKDGDSYLFYGAGQNAGSGPKDGSLGRVRARVKAFAISELIKSSSNVIIMGHKNPDYDFFGAAVGIYKIAKFLDIRCNILLNEKSHNVEMIFKRFVTLPEYAQNVFIGSNTALSLMGSNTLLIIADCHKPSILESPELLSAAKKTVIIDHHRRGTDFIENSVLAYHEPYASSTSELVTEMLQYMKVKITRDEADALLAGLTLDTNNFTFKTGTITFESCAFLLRNGADAIRVRRLFKNDRDAYKAVSYVVNNAEFIDDIAFSVCPSDIANPVIATAQAADELLGIMGVQASFVLCECDNVHHEFGDTTESKLVVISARSLGETNVQIIMEKLGGGGHNTMAGAQLTGITLDEAASRLKAAVAECKS